MVLEVEPFHIGNVRLLNVCFVHANYVYFVFDVNNAFPPGIMGEQLAFGNFWFQLTNTTSLTDKPQP
jgi:hypothetical protein